MIARYIGRDLERVWVLALLTGRLLTTGSAYSTGRSESRDASFTKIDATGPIREAPQSAIPEEVETADETLRLAG